MWLGKFQLESLEVEIFKNFHVRMVDDLKISVWRLEMRRFGRWKVQEIGHFECYNRLNLMKFLRKLKLRTTLYRRTML